MNFLKQCYIELDNLKYSEENIAELFSILNRIVKFLKSQNPNRKTNQALCLEDVEVVLIEGTRTASIAVTESTEELPENPELRSARHIRGGEAHKRD
ncbi:MAG: hypothetical protein R6W78_14530, partial [Bacteroidales bacterium]